jgi:hypothetical protein
MKEQNITPMSNPPRFDPKTERYRHYAIRVAGVIWAAILASYVYLMVHWALCPL